LGTEFLVRLYGVWVKRVNGIVERRNAGKLEKRRNREEKEEEEKKNKKMRLLR